MTTAAIDLSDSAIWQAGFPHEVFTRLRQEAPLFHHELTPGVAAQVQRDFWMCTKHRHCVRIHRDTDSFTAADGPVVQTLDTFSAYPSIVNMDPPEVNKRRKILSSAFTPRAIAKLEEGIRWRAKAMVDELYAGGGGDWVTQVAARLPMTVIGDIIGIPEADRPRVDELVNDIVKTKDPNSGLRPEDEAGLYMELFQYAAALTADKRHHPTDDIWSTLALATATDDDGKQYALGENELEMFFFVLGLAGSDTTKNALTAGLQAYCWPPGSDRSLPQRPVRTLTCRRGGASLDHTDHLLGPRRQDRHRDGRPPHPRRIACGVDAGICQPRRRCLPRPLPIRHHPPG